MRTLGCLDVRKRWQAKVAKAYIDQLDQAHAFGAKIVTTIEPGRTFYPAEGYHQNFATLHPEHPYIAFNDRPKIENFKRLFPDWYQAAPVLVGSEHAAN